MSSTGHEVVDVPTAEVAGAPEVAPGRAQGNSIVLTSMRSRRTWGFLKQCVSLHGFTFIAHVAAVIEY